MQKSYSDLKKFSITQGADLFGVADIKEIKNEFALSKDILEKYNRAVCIGIRLSAGILDEIIDAPTRLYFNHYRTVNNLLDQSSLKISNYIQNKGFLALPIPASIILDWQNQRGHLSHKKVAVLAGLGWIGRNNLLVNPVIGSQLRLATILTNMPLKIDKPVKKGCGSCQACIKVCPAGAISQDADKFDYIKCFDKLKEFQKQKLVDQYICGVCVNVCAGKR